jgi:MEMO1 family protein
VTAIRPPAVAGLFYPAEPDVLRRQLTHLMSEATRPIQGTTSAPKAIIGPHAGYPYSGAIAARAYTAVADLRSRIKRVVLIGPSHHIAYQGLAIDTMTAWTTPLGTVALDTEAIERLRQTNLVGTLDAAFAREHALEVHVPFLQHVLDDFKLVPIVAGDATPEHVAAVLDELWGGPETLIVVSTDLSHYLDYDSCQRTDTRTADAIEHFAFDRIGPHDACGRVPTNGLLLTAQRRAMTITRLDLRNSGDTAGTRDRVVGYGAWMLSEPAPDDDRKAVEAARDILLGLARDSIQSGFRTGQPAYVAAHPGLPPLLTAPGAAFVTLKLNGQLRGCIGSFMAYRPLLTDVTQHAFNAAFRDPRFQPLTLPEARNLDLSVSVLTRPTTMHFRYEADLLAQLRPGVDGLIIEDRGQRALFLPSVWEELPNSRDFLAHLKHKAGMPIDHFSPGFQASRFQSIEVKGPMVPGLR